MPAPYLKNRRTGIVLPYNEHLAKHPDMSEIDELPYKVPKPKRRGAKKAATQAQAPASAPPPLGDAEINDLVAGLDSG